MNGPLPFQAAALPRHQIKVSLFAALICIAFLCNGTQAKDNAQPKLQTVTLTINSNHLKTEIARTGQQRYMGLSFRTQMAQDEAMLFVYEQEQPLIFTMRNTLIPLSIAFISKEFKINEIVDMPVGATHNFPSAKPAQYALEVNQGWFEQNGIGVGAQITMQ